MSHASKPLLSDHARIQKVIERMETAIERADPDSLRREWTALEDGVCKHFAVEEELLFPLLEPTYQDEVAALAHDHDDIRGEIEQIALEIELHTLRKERADALLTKLGLHAQREEELLYRMADQLVTDAQRTSLVQRLGLRQPTDQPLRRETDLSFDDAEQRVRTALAEQGFGVLTEIDVKATLKQKLDQEFRRYTILGACNPGFAHRALTHDLEVGTLLPCNVVVYEDDQGRTVVSAVDPATLLPGDSEELEEIADEVRRRLSDAITAV